MASVVKRGARWSAILPDRSRKSGQRWVRLPPSVTTKGAALREALRLQDEAERKALSLPSNSPNACAPSWLDLAARFIAEKRRHGATADWICNLEQFVKRFLAFAGDIPADRVTRPLCREFLTERLNQIEESQRPAPKGEKRRKMSVATLRKEIFFLSSVWKRAIEDDVLESNPWEAIRRPAEPPGKDRFLTSGELEALLEVAPPERAVRYLFLAFTGLRRGEALRVRWGDVDLARGQLKVINARKGKSDGMPTYRAIPIPDRLIEVLRPRAGNVANCVLGPSSNNWRRDLMADAKKAGLAHLRLHDLRHTYGSWLAQAGVPLIRIAELMGHRSAATTEKYAHLAPVDRGDITPVFDGAGAGGVSRGLAKIPEPVLARVVDVAEKR